MMGFRVVMYAGGLVCACVYLAKLKEVRELTSAAHRTTTRIRPTSPPDRRPGCSADPLASRRGQASCRGRDQITAFRPKSPRRPVAAGRSGSYDDLSAGRSCEFPHRRCRIVEPEEIMPPHSRRFAWIAFMLVLAGLLPASDLKTALDGIKPAQILEHIKVLASDEYEGRGPGTPGEDKTVAYLTGQFQKMGLKPGNPDGTYRPGCSAGRLSGEAGERVVPGGTKTVALSFPDDFVAVSRRMAEEVKVGGDSDVVFVGYGVVAPEYGWDDYKGLDVRGKTLIMLVNDPAVPDPNDPSKLDPAAFQGPGDDLLRALDVQV